jgi:FMN phosphatase YigB (HAD superfamily)
MPDLLLIDLGNVLVRFDHGRTLRAIASAAGVADPESLRPAVFGRNEFDFDTGRLDAISFFRAVERDAGLQSIPDEIWIPAWRDIFEPIPEAFALLADLRPGVRTCLVSNTNPLHWEGVRAVCSVESLVSGLALSFEVGAAKPDPALFRYALDLAGFPPDQAAFADDRPDYVEAARALGIDSFVVTSPRDLAEGLRVRGLLRPRRPPTMPGT